VLSRPSAPFRAAPPRELQPTMSIEALDKYNWDQLEEFDGLSVVKFYAPWCRTCRTIAPAYKTFAAKLKDENVRFFEVNFAKSKELSLSERVFKLPTIHFYTRALGRVNAFTLTRAGGVKQLQSEVDRYQGESGHLQMLQSFRSTAMAPMVRYVELVGVMKALAEETTDGETEPNELISKAVGSAERKRQLDAVFEAIDANADGVLDADELEAVAEMVGPLLAVETPVRELLERIGPKDGAEEAREAPYALDRERFYELMTSKAARDFAAPEKELLPAFEAMDTNGDGVISREEMMQTMARISSEDAEEMLSVFDVLDVDKDSTIDYEEFVAVMSGASYKKAA